MILRKDLMIGDYVMYRDRYVQISQIKAHNVSVIDGLGKRYGIPFRELFDIPISFSIMDKNFPSDPLYSKSIIYKKYIIEDLPYTIRSIGGSDCIMWVNSTDKKSLDSYSFCSLYSIRELQHVLNLFKINHKMIF